jgi:hypothetical protein
MKNAMPSGRKLLINFKKTPKPAEQTEGFVAENLCSRRHE